MAEYKEPLIIKMIRGWSTITGALMFGLKSCFGLLLSPYYHVSIKIEG